MQNFRALGASPPDPRASGCWGFAPKPTASSGWELRPQTLLTAPLIANFWLRVCSELTRHEQETNPGLLSQPT